MMHVFLCPLSHTVQVTLSVDRLVSDQTPFCKCYTLTLSENRFGWSEVISLQVFSCTLITSNSQGVWDFPTAQGNGEKVGRVVFPPLPLSSPTSLLAMSQFHLPSVTVANFLCLSPNHDPFSLFKNKILIYYFK